MKSHTLELTLFSGVSDSVAAQCMSSEDARNEQGLRSIGAETHVSAIFRGDAVEEKSQEQQALLTEDLRHPPEADLPEAGSAQSIELTEGQPSTLGSDAVDRVSWTHSNSVSTLSTCCQSSFP